jgi:hypothetical protein
MGYYPLLSHCPAPATPSDFHLCPERQALSDALATDSESAYSRQRGPREDRVDQSPPDLALIGGGWAAGLPRSAPQTPAVPRRRPRVGRAQADELKHRIIEEFARDLRRWHRQSTVLNSAICLASASGQGGGAAMARDFWGRSLRCRGLIRGRRDSGSPWASTSDVEKVPAFSIKG